MMDAVKRSLPGWSLARDAPRPKQKQGWECPAPTVEDWEDYKKWKEQQERKEELPPAPQIYLADTELLFYRDPDVQLPWVHRIKCELPRRVGRLSGELPVKASYIGFGTNDDPEHYELFKAAMAQIGIVLCRQIKQPPSRFELAHLEQSDLILIGGGDRKRLWETLGTDFGGNAVAEHVKWRYLQGAVIIAVGEAMSVFGHKSWYTTGQDQIIPYTGWKIFPHVVASEEEGVDMEDMVETMGGAGVVILGIHKGSGMIFNRDGLVEPIRGMIQEYRWDWQTKSVKHALLLGPPRSTGLICPLYAAMKRSEGDADEDVPDVFAYSLTEEEEHEEERFMEQFDQYNLWLSSQGKEEVEALKREGNEAFKGGKLDLASLKYEQARVLLRSSACKWTELDKAVREELEALSKPKKAAAKTAAQKEDFRATTLLLSLLLNLCACHLLLHEQDLERRAASAAAPEAAAAEVGETTIVEAKDRLAAAFRAANEALRLSGGRSAKAWYRRGCAFERMRDPRNAARDFDEALLRSPGDKEITRRRDAAKEKASGVAENMYYARYKELDAEERRLELASRRGLLLKAADDAYRDESHQFALAQPVAALVEATLEEVDGRPRLVVDGDRVAAEGAPYLHVHALWTWEHMVQRAPKLQVLHIEDVDLGSGPLEWLCKGLRSHSEVQVLKLIGVHLGPAGGRMMRNVIAQNRSLADIALDRCALLDAGADEIAAGLRENCGRLETLSLQCNRIGPKRIGKLADALLEAEAALDLSELDLSGNPFAVEGAKEVGRIIASGELKLRVLRLQNCALDLAAFWRLVGNLDDARPLTHLDLRCNPIGRGTRRCWRSQMGPTIRCEVQLSDHPLKAHRQARLDDEEADELGYPSPRHWV